MTIKEYTLQDAEAKLNEISNIALFYRLAHVLER